MARSKKARWSLAAAIAVGLGGIVLLEAGGANTAHLTGASGILTMKECLACHSEGSLRPIAICLGDHCLYTNNHPVMHRYPPSGREASFAPVAQILAAGAVLEDGNITCLSCHDLTKPAPHLVKSGEGLCFICHIDLKP